MTPEETTTPLVGYSVDERVALVTMARPERLNALTTELHEQLRTAIEQAARDPGVGAVVLTGAGRGFCAGGDMNSGRRSADEPRPTLEQRADELMHHGETVKLLHGMPKPTIAMVNGPAAGAGMALALACDIRIGSTEAVLKTAYSSVALSGDLGISWFLTRLVGPSRAKELLFFGDRIQPEQALQLGLLNRVESPEALQSVTMELAHRLARGPAVALRYMKRHVNLASDESLDTVIGAEAFGMARCGRTQDIKEAALAFREKRPPNFTGS